jgi:hypothetical protein
MRRGLDDEIGNRRQELAKNKCVDTLGVVYS